jgi:NADH-dependent peroxiredoxin subunit F
LFIAKETERLNVLQGDIMNKFMDEQTRKELKHVLGHLENPVKILFFTQQHACGSCRDQQNLLQEFASLSNKIELEIYDFIKDSEASLKYNIDMIPATIVMGDKDYGIRFYGLTSGYEFSSLLQAVLMISNNKSGLSPEMENLVGLINEPVRVQVMVTMTCPYCFQMVHTAHQFAFINEFIRGEMIDAVEFSTLSQRYDVSSVPKTVINETHSFVGSLSPESVYLEILKSVRPDRFHEIEELMLEAQVPEHIRQADENKVYELIIIGGGPAAMSAAIYASRKDLDVLIIAKKFGGQVNYTANVENFLGFRGVIGREMGITFRQHMESFPLSEISGFNVSAIDKTNDHFTVTLDDGRQFSSNSVIYCAGKEYKKLGIPGEERYIGKGIGFCATCDAPFYRGRKVAVIGGGNSAFTAARDLLNYASEIHLIHRRNVFSADESLVSSVADSRKIHIHKNMVVREVLGNTRLMGVRLMSADGEEWKDIPVDGVFLEIGLSPNTGPIKNLLKLNEKHEIPVDCRAATEIPGFFAAGDVTDVPEKQIAIAVGEGAKAALTAHKYLLSKDLTGSRVRIGESWE